MNLVKKGFSFYVFGNIHVALAVYSLVKLTSLQFGSNNDEIACLSFFGTIVSYNLIRYFQLDKLNTSISIWIKANRNGLLVLNFLAGAGCVFYLVKLERSEVWLLIPLVFATFFYVLPFRSGTTGLRGVPMLKLLLISFIWAALTVILPLVSSTDYFSDSMWLILGQRFFFVFAITIPFDIRDADFDKPELLTLPHLIGTDRSKLIAIIALMACIYVSSTLYELRSSNYIIDTVIMSISMILVLFTNVRRLRYYTAFWIESLPILWYLFYLVFADQFVFENHDIGIILTP
ncbi:hypothetical protein [Lutimonas zeaxanthinifaciens]|uniref:hypothetical protein n=1 Tax=Lutimonas zeaxanthinifaciens TaxID=3060215 RepID=UPI00265CA650|nr:hypothetical protein [Lutimonas sp. YSD2104]WKK64942.1 hypothetical protein QZH61_10150 [Lutimonas sp. YSD2104]